MSKRKRLEPSLVFNRDYCDVTIQVQKFLMEMKRISIGYPGKLEIEAKIGHIIDKSTNQRLVYNVKSECIVDFKVQFKSDVSIKQHSALNKILNQKVPKTCQYKHVKQVDEFYGRTRVSKVDDQVIESIQKTRLGDLHVYNPNQLYDYRLSVNVENPQPVPVGKPTNTRFKDRISYTCWPCQIDLTLVKSIEKSHELEVEFLGIDDIDQLNVIDAFVSCIQSLCKTQYDGDNSTWSPQGRIHQVEYAMEAVKQGSATVALCSKTHAIVIGLKRTPGELASYQKKVLRIDSHLGVGYSGLVSDARVLTHYMISESLYSKMMFNRPIPVSRLVAKVADRAQINTQRYGKRPYGVGLLVIGYDTQARLYECSPDGNATQYRAISIGSRSQSAKTSLERNIDSFENASLNELISFGLKSLRDTLSQDKQLTIDNTCIGIVGVDQEFKLVEGQDVLPYLELINQEPAPMDTAE